MAGVCLYSYLSLFFFLSLFSDKGFGTQIVVDNISVGERKNYNLNNTVEYIVEVDNLSNDIVEVPPRISVQCLKCQENNPLLLVVRKKKGVISWEVPLVVKSENYFLDFKNTERTLCPIDIVDEENSLIVKENAGYSDDISQPVTLGFSTSSNTNIEVEIVVNLEKNFVINLQSNVSVQVSPSTPSFYHYKFSSDNVHSILVHIASDDDTCLIVSIQNASCPVFDLEENVEYRGHFQSVTRQGGIVVTKESFPHGFYIVLIVTVKDSYCASTNFERTVMQPSQARTKNVVLTVSKTLSSNEYTLAVGLTFAFIFLFCTAMVVVEYFSNKKDKDSAPILDEECIVDQMSEPSVSTHLPYNASSIPVTPVTPGTDTLSIKTDSSLDEADFDLVNDAELDKNIFRMKGILFVCDLARKSQNVLRKKSDLYFWNILTVAIFYFLPVIQLVINDQFQVFQSGREDLCYYNFLCAHPLWIFLDFNHVFSNIGYISFGILFMCLTFFKEKVYKRKMYNTNKLYRNYGIPQHFGLFYAMGAALIIEGVLSSCYHICPNHHNFQFDSSFMYVICTLCMIKIYQSRHPDINPSAYATFFLLAGVVFTGMCGVLSNSLTFWICFTVVYLSTCIYLSLKIYYLGTWKLEFCSLVRFLKELRPCRNCNLRFFTPTYPSRFVLLVIANACNVGLASASFIYDRSNFSSYLLSIFMVNLMLYTTFYIFMKFICRERLHFLTIIYILLSIIGWSSALYFFFNKTISWKLSPAKSKLFNQECKILNFYDNHDIWHFISSAAMFFSFMVLLTLDDDLLYVPRSKILVF